MAIQKPSSVSQKVHRGSKIGLACVVSCAALFGSAQFDVAQLLTHNQNISSQAYAEEAVNSFEAAQKHGTKTSFGDYDVYALLLSKDNLTKKSYIALYVELKMPNTYQDYEFDNHDEFFFKPNPYQTIYFEIDDAHKQPNKYDDTIFRNNGPESGFPLDSSTKKLTLTIKGEEVEIDIPSSSTALDVEPLESALIEHENDYQTALSAGIEVTDASKKEFEDVTAQARTLVEEAKKADTKVTQDQLNDMRTTYNTSFAKLTPKPFNRTQLQEALKKAKAAEELNGKDGKRYKKEAYEKFERVYQRALELADAKDLTSIVGPREGGPLPTHTEYTTVPAALMQAISELELESFSALDKKALQDEYNRDIELMPAAGKGYTPASAEPYYTALVKAQEVLQDTYASAEDLQTALDNLKNTQANLQEVELDATQSFDLVIKYRHPLDDSPSEKIDAYFREGDKDVESKISGVLAGAEMRLYLDDYEHIKKFPGYEPKSFFYAAKDTSTDTVRVLKDSKGKRFILFTTELNGGLDIKYLKGNDMRGTAESSSSVQSPEVPKTTSPAVSNSSLYGAFDMVDTTDDTLQQCKLPKTSDNTANAPLIAVASFIAACSILALRRKFNA